jgi:hypothetical protein
VYLYIFEDGSMLQMQEPPTEFDLASIDSGTLTVITVVGGKFSEYDAAGDIYDLPEGVQKSFPTTEGAALMTVSKHHAEANDS